MRSRDALILGYENSIRRYLHRLEQDFDHPMGCFSARVHNAS